MVISDPRHRVLKCVSVYVYVYTYTYIYSSIPLTLALIGRDGGLSTPGHSCGFACQQRVLKTVSGPAYHYSEEGVVWLWHLMVNLYIYIYIYIYIYVYNIYITKTSWRQYKRIYIYSILPVIFLFCFPTDWNIQKHFISHLKPNFL